MNCLYATFYLSIYHHSDFINPGCPSDHTLFQRLTPNFYKHLQSFKLKSPKVFFFCLFVYLGVPYRGFDNKP